MHSLGQNPSWLRKKFFLTAAGESASHHLVHSFGRLGVTSNTQVRLCSVIEHQHQCTTHATQNICHESLVQTCHHTLLCSNLFEAVHCALVKVLLRWLLTLHLEASSHSVKRVGSTSTDGDGSLCGSESADCTCDPFVLFPWVQPRNCVKSSQLESTVPNNAH